MCSAHVLPVSPSRGLPGGVSLRSMSRPLGYAHSLDGIRALCLLAVLFYHAGLPWAVGGYLGVSTFFTLSGFLITQVLTSEIETTGRVRFGRFAVRRAQRLLPAALLTLGIIAATAPLWVGPAQLERLGTDLVACVAYVINWRFIDEGYAYALLFVAPSEVQHFWSLAIEGQFYGIFPLVVAAGYRNRERPRLLMTVLFLGALLSLAWGAFLFETAGQERVYFGTDTRIAELLVGALLALLLRAKPGASGPASARVSRWLDVAGLVALFGIVAAWARASLATPALYRGGFGLYALASALVILGCLQGEGRLRALLSPAPLRYVGRISYGAYLYHWPLLLWIDSLELAAAPRLALLLGTTLGLAALSHRFLEEPLRRRRTLPGARVAWSAAIGSALVVAIAVVQLPPLRDDALQLARSLGPGTPKQDGAARIAVFGDSTAIHIANGLGRWTRDRPDAAQSFSVTRMGCGLLQAYVLQRDEPRSGADRGPCQLFYEDALRSVEKGRPDLSVVLFGPWEVEGYVDPGDGKRHLLGSPEADAVLRDATLAFVDVLSSQGGHVAWLDVPTTVGGRDALLDAAARERARERINATLRSLAAERPDQLTLVELSAQLRDLERRGEAPRPDGTHFSRESAFQLIDTWLGPRALEILAARTAHDQDQD